MLLASLDHFRRGSWIAREVDGDRLLTTFAVLAEAERDFNGLKAELAAVAQR